MKYEREDADQDPERSDGTTVLLLAYPYRVHDSVRH
jgi:hypothetical protein